MDGEPRSSRERAAIDVLIGAVGAVGMSPAWYGSVGPSSGGRGGTPRPRRWDAVVSTHAESLTGDSVHFVALAGGDLIVDEAEPDGSVAPLAAAVEAELEPPYRAEAVRHDGSVWAAGALRVGIVDIPGLSAGSIEASKVEGLKTFVVDGEEAGSQPVALEAFTSLLEGDWAIMATPLVDDTWVVDAWSL